MEDITPIEEAEARLRAAMIAGDADTLDALLSDDTMFTNQDGVRMGKAADLAAHRSGLLRIERIDPHEPATIRRLDADTAIVCVTLDLAGTYDGQPFGGAFAYSRVWRRGGDARWRIEAAHCSTVARAPDAWVLVDEQSRHEG